MTDIEHSVECPPSRGAGKQAIGNEVEGASSSGGGAGSAAPEDRGGPHGPTASTQATAGEAPCTPAAVEEPEANEVAGDIGELVATAAQRDEYLALAQRTQADFENYRKRVARESAQAQERGVARLAKELLPALDSLDRALEAAEQDDPLLNGVRLVHSELMAALARVGIESFAPLGEPFDPNMQEAVAQQPVAGAQSGTVAEVYQNGYRHQSGTVLRPARVLVAA
jgi:molecular chaperone GrpE